MATGSGTCSVSDTAVPCTLLPAIVGRTTAVPLSPARNRTTGRWTEKGDIFFVVVIIIIIFNLRAHSNMFSPPRQTQQCKQKQLQSLPFSGKVEESLWVKCSRLCETSNCFSRLTILQGQSTR